MLNRIFGTHSRAGAVRRFVRDRCRYPAAIDQRQRCVKLVGKIGRPTTVVGECSYGRGLMQVTAPTELNGFNVSYWWQSGHPVREEFGLLLTQSGHREPPINEASDDAGALNFVRSFQLDSFSIFALCPCAAASLGQQPHRSLSIPTLHPKWTWDWLEDRQPLHRVHSSCSPPRRCQLDRFEECRPNVLVWNIGFLRLPKAA